MNILIFYHLAYLKKHRLHHANPFKYECEHSNCSQRFLSSNELIQHLNESHSGSHPFQCEQCNKQCINKVNLQKHLYQHKVKSIKCNECNEVFNKKTQLLIHQSEVHGYDKPYKCDWPGCDYKSIYEQTLRTHQLRHTGEKPFKCSWYVYHHFVLSS